MSQFRIDLRSRRFQRAYKKALKKYPLIKNDIVHLFSQLESEPVGDPMPGFQRTVWKARVPVQGHLSKRHGYRLIYHVDWTHRVITPMFFYSKSEVENVSKREIDKAASEISSEFVDQLLRIVSSKNQPPDD